MLSKVGGIAQFRLVSYHNAHGFADYRLFVALAALVVIQGARASSGDRSLSFQTCLTTCLPGRCMNTLPLTQRITMWTCQDDCAYECTHTATDAAEASIRIFGPRAARVEQFYGKWAFWRLWGMQEPASVAFSLLNLQAHLSGLGLLRRRVPRNHPMRKYYLAWSLVGANAWIWSAIFHTRGNYLYLPPVQAIIPY